MLSRLKRARRPHGYEWSTFGYEILSNLTPSDYNLVGKEIVLRHNSRNVFRAMIREESCLVILLKDLERRGKEGGNKHISGFCCVAERTKIGGSQTLRGFVETHLTRLLRSMARGILSRVDGFEERRDDYRPSPSDVITVDDNGEGGREDFETAAPPALLPNIPPPLPSSIPSLNPLDPSCTWPLVVYAGAEAGGGIEANRDWMNFLLMCQCIANTLGVSHQEAVYHNCIKMEMARRQVPHISHFHCVQRLPGGEMAKIGELDLLVELKSGNFLVELKVCSQWRRFENQLKKYINAVHSMGYRCQGAAIVNFNPRGVIEVAMFDAASRHAPAPSL
jgi:hypothetical protein